MNQTTTLTADEAYELNALAEDPREQKALKEGMAVVANYGWARDDPEKFLVYSQDGVIYRVHTGEWSCNCKDHEFRNTYCKHQRRVDIVRGAKPLPPRTEPFIDGILARQLGLRD